MNEGKYVMQICNTLKNGIRIVTEQVPHVYSASIGLWIRTGSADENISNNGIAHMIEHMLFKGTVNRTAKELADETAAVGGEINAYTSKEFTSLYACVLSEHLPKTIELLGDMLNNSLFDKTDLEKEKNIVMDEIDMYKDSPEDVAHEMLQMSVWENHPLGYLISGEKQTVRNFTSGELKQFMSEHYAGENIVISVAGRFDGEEVMKLLEKEFSGIGRTAVLKDTEPPVFRPAVYIEEKDIEQIHINMAFPATDCRADDRYAYTVMNNILGGGANSRLFMRIREELGLTYSIDSYGSTFLNAGLFHICASLNPEQFETAVKEIINILNELKTNGPDGKELLYAKEQIKTDLLLQYESTKAIMNRNAKSIVLFDKLIPDGQMLSMVNSITGEDIKKCLCDMMKTGEFGIAVVGNVNKSIERQCRQLSLR